MSPSETLRMPGEWGNWRAGVRTRSKLRAERILRGSLFRGLVSVALFHTYVSEFTHPRGRERTRSRFTGTTGQISRK